MRYCCTITLKSTKIIESNYNYTKVKGKIKQPPRILLEVYDIYNWDESIVFLGKNLKMELGCSITFIGGC